MRILCLHIKNFGTIKKLTKKLALATKKKERIKKND